MALIMYIIPSYFVRKDVYKAADEIHELLLEEQKHLQGSQQRWIKDALETTKENIDAMLFMFYEAPQFRTGLVFDPKQSERANWLALARVIGYDPSIGFAQLHAPAQNKSALLTPHSAHLYSIQKISTHKEAVLITLAPQNKNQESQTFIGYPLPHTQQQEQGYIFYALLDPKQAQEHISVLKEEIAKLTPEFIEKQLYEGNQLAVGGQQKDQPAFQWASKVNLIRSLALLYAEGFQLSKSTSQPIPAGIARVDSKSNGYAILSQEIFSTRLLFDDALYYQQHLPQKGNPPVANGSVIVTEKPQNHAYIGNTLLLDHTYFTLGIPLKSLARQLALSTNAIVFLQANHTFWMGFDGEGNRLPQEIVDQIVNKGIFKQHSGLVELGGQTYTFARVISLENDSLALYDLHLYGGEQTIVSTLLALENKLTRRISMQLSLIAIGTMFLVLLFIGRIGYTVIYPITKLAAATQDVVAGRYEEVILPEVGNRQDEVATLTRSFEEMVTGLQEREKIRGVLDKVVSKDVADEILRTQIHLGGEDRVVTMLFCDIRGFSTLTSTLAPQKTIALLNACMTKVSRVIEGEGGVIDKYVGDEVMAIFGAPTGHPDHALRAVSTGMLIVETLKKWNEARAAAGEQIIFEMGIGIHTGLVVAGNMGAEDRLNYTVLGANVNLAARLCEVAQPNQLIISAATLAQPNVKQSFYTKALSPITLKGFTESVKIYEITSFKWEE